MKTQHSANLLGGALEYKLYHLEARSWASLILQALLILNASRQMAPEARAGLGRELQVQSLQESTHKSGGGHMLEWKKDQRGSG